MKIDRPIINKCLLLICIVFLPLTAPAQQSDCDCYERLNNLSMYYYLQENYADGLDAMKKAIDYRGNDASLIDYKMLARFYAKCDSLEQSYDSILNAISKGLSMDELFADNFSEVRSII